MPSLLVVLRRSKSGRKPWFDEQGPRMKSVIADLAMENELLRERIRRMEDEKPFLRWRSRK